MVWLQAATGKQRRLLPRPRAATEGNRYGHAVIPGANEAARVLQLRGLHRRSEVERICSAHIRQLQSVNGKMVPIRTILDECRLRRARARRCRALWGGSNPVVVRRPADWAYDGTDPSELYDTERLVVAYSRFPEFYMPMCKPCHKERDVERRQAERRLFREWRRVKCNRSVSTTRRRFEPGPPSTPESWFPPREG